MRATISLPEDQDSGLPFYAARVKTTRTYRSRQLLLLKTQSTYTPPSRMYTPPSKNSATSTFTSYTGEASVFDDLHDEEHKHILPSSGSDPPADETFAFIQFTGRAFLPILSKRHFIPYTDDQRRWQLLRHGRYVEFMDRGTKFSLMTPGARIEYYLYESAR